MTFIEKLKVLMDERNIKVPQLSRESGVKATTIYAFWDKGYENIKLSNFKAICDYFDVTMDSMAIDEMDIEPKKNHINRSKSDDDVIRMLHSINRKTRDSLVGYIKLEYEKHVALMEQEEALEST